MGKVKVARPNQVWADDITYLPMARGFLYLVAIMDWHSRYVVAWGLTNTLEADSCVDASTEALGHGRPRRSTPTKAASSPESFRPRGGDQHGQQGRYSDNIFVERLWRTVKYEEVYLKAYANVAEARMELGACFRFYNNQRPHQSLGYRTPAEVFHGEQGVVEGESNGRRCSPEEGTESLAGEPGLSLNPGLILSN